MSLPWRDAPKAIPAIILVVVLLVTSVAAWTDNSDWRTSLLDNQLVAAWDKDDYETAELIILRQLRQRPDDGRLVYRLGLARDLNGENEAALDLMKKLAFGKRNERAARWILEKEYLGKDWEQLDDEGKDEFGRILALIHQEAPKDMAIKRLYADYLIAAEKLPQAIPVLEELARVQPMRGLQAAALARRLGNEATANRFAERTLDAVSRMSEEDPTNAVLALAVAQNQLFLKRFAETVRTLDRSIPRVKDDDERNMLKQAMGDTIVAWVAHIEESPVNSVNDRLRILKMLQTALRYAPSNLRVMTVVADEVLAVIDEDDAKIAAVREALIDGSSAGIAHFIRGTAALMNDDVESATISLQLAAKHMPQSGAILNNLAVALAEKGGEDNLEKALRISESAIKETPNLTPHYFETRGQILFKMGRFLDAIPDLERSLAVESLAKQSHKTLAVCYEKLGEKQLSNLHLEAAKEDELILPSTDENEKTR